MPLLHYCCCKVSNKTGSVAIGSLFLLVTVVGLGVTIGLIAGWESFDTSFLVDASNRLRDWCEESRKNVNYTGNCTKREFVATKIDNLQERVAHLSSTIEKVGPIWKNEFVSLFAFLPWYALANVLLILGAWKEVKLLLLIWIGATIVALIWGLILCSILFTFDTTVGFVVGIALFELMGFAVSSYFILIVFSLYQELTAKTIKELIIGRAEDYINSTPNNIGD